MYIQSEGLFLELTESLSCFLEDHGKESFLFLIFMFIASWIPRVNFSKQPLRIGVLGSTNGTDLKYIFEAIDERKITNVNISVVISNKEKSFILERARLNHIPAVYISAENKAREDFDTIVTETLRSHGVWPLLLSLFIQCFRLN